MISACVSICWSNGSGLAVVGVFDMVRGLWGTSLVVVPERWCLPDAGLLGKRPGYMDGLALRMGGAELVVGGGVRQMRVFFQWAGGIGPMIGGH